MSFLPLLTSSSSTSSNQNNYKPASVSYFTIFCPALKPLKPSGNNDNDNDSAEEISQILFYTSRERAVVKDKMLRQIGIAKGLIEFSKMVSPTPVGKFRHAKSWNVHSSKKRMVLVQVQDGLWIHACIELPSTTRASALPSSSHTPSATHSNSSRDYHDSILVDEWIQESILRAWRDWRLLNGPIQSILQRENGRKLLEKSLEKHFSVWVWSWNLEAITSPSADPQKQVFGSILNECLQGFPIVPRAPRSKLSQLMHSFDRQHLDQRSGLIPSATLMKRRRQMVVLYDTSVLWPFSDAGCFELPDSQPFQETRLDFSSDFLDPQDRIDILRRVVSHLSGLERERELVRMAASTSANEGRRRGTLGALKERGTTKGTGKYQERSGTVSSSLVKTKSTLSAVPSPASSETGIPLSLKEAGKWPGWGSVLVGLGKLNLGKNESGSSTPRSSSMPPHPESSKPHPADVVGLAPAFLTTVQTPLNGSTNQTASLSIGKEPDQQNCPPRLQSIQHQQKQTLGAFQSLQQRLVEAIPIQETSSIWTGAENAFKGIGASLWLGISGSHTQVSESTESKPSNPSEAFQNTMVAETSNEESHKGDELTKLPQSSQTCAKQPENTDDPRLADTTLNYKASAVKPDVDVDPLAQVMKGEPVKVTVSDDKTVSPDTRTSDNAIHFDQPHTQVGVPVESRFQQQPIDKSNLVPSKVTASSKAFPAMSITSAAWYNSKSKGAASLNISESGLGSGRPSSKASSPLLDSLSRDDKSDTWETLPTRSLPDQDLLTSAHHNFELDGWGYEEAVAFQSFKGFVGGQDDSIVSSDLKEGGGEQDRQKTEQIQVFFTTRRLLTFVLIESVGQSGAQQQQQQGGPFEPCLTDAWELLRRVQRVMNDYDRTFKMKQAEDDQRVKFVHMDGPSLMYHDKMNGTTSSGLDDDTRPIAESHCLSARTDMKRHDIRETFARSNNGKTWTASRLSRPTSHSDRRGGLETSHTNERSKAWHERNNTTYMVVAGKKISIVDCDNELRKLANEYPSFGL